jgi:hypothetical protein
MEFWLQSNVKDVVSDCTPAVGHPGGELGWRRNSFIAHLVRWAQAHSAWDRDVELMAKRQRGADSDKGPLVQLIAPRK